MENHRVTGTAFNPFVPLKSRHRFIEFFLRHLQIVGQDRLEHFTCRDRSRTMTKDHSAPRMPGQFSDSLFIAGDDQFQ